MNKGHVFYEVSPNEPSPFTGVVNEVNDAWVEYTCDLMMGNAAKGMKAFAAIKSFLDSGHVQVNPATGKVAHTDNTHRAAFLNGHFARTVREAGKVLQQRLQEDIKIALPGFYDVPTKAVTSDGHIAFKWVIYVAHMDGMTLDEAHLYALSLGKQPNAH